jgi:hypothetical protein
MSAYDLQAARCRLQAFRNRCSRRAATLYAERHATVRLALDLFDRLYLAYPDPARQAGICYWDNYGASRYDWSSDADIPDLPAGEPAEVAAWVELWDGDLRLDVVFTPDEVQCLKFFVDRDWNETLLKDVPLPYEEPHLLDSIERFLGDGGWPVRLPTVATRTPSGATAAVLAGAGQWAVEGADCLDFLASLPEGAVRLVLGSPPYPEKGERYLGDPRKWRTDDWVEWMFRVTEEAVRVSSGDVLWVANGAVRYGRYLPACEGLVWEWHRRGGVCERPCIWHKNAPPNRGDWFGNNWEFVLAFRKPGVTRTFNWEAIAEPLKYTRGGRLRQRTTDGQRRLGSAYPQNKLARPRDVFRVTVGGGHLSSELAHENEAPYPEQLVEPFVRVLTNPGDIVCDPFSGSGTTGAVALRHGRRFLGCDSRQSQVDLSRVRLRTEEEKMLAGGPGQRCLRREGDS